MLELLRSCRAQFTVCLLLSIMTMPLLHGQQGGAPTPSQSSPAAPVSPSTAVRTSTSAGSEELVALRALIDRGRTAEAFKQLDLLAAQQPEPAGVELLRGIALYSQNDFAVADQALAAALTQNSKDVEAAQMRGLTLFRLGRPAEAIPLLESIREWAPTTRADPSYVLALCYLETRRYDDARHAFARQYSFAPDSASAYLLAGRMLLRREYLPVAEEYARKALSLNPHLPLAHLLLGEVALAGQHIPEAVAEFEKERELNPLYGGIYDRLGDAYTRAGDYEHAQRSLEEALLLEPNSTGPFILLGKVLLKRQDPVTAANYLERAEKMDPSNYMTHSLLGQAYRAMGRTDDARQQTATAEKLQAANTPKLENVH